MLVSVIIPTLNRSRLLKKTLFCLCEQITDYDFEIIVVDNGSCDNTREVAEAYQAKGKNRLIYIFDDRPGLLVGRNVGAQRASGDILSFIDDDVITPPCWLQGIVDVFKDEKISLATGNNYPLFEGSPPKWLNRMWHGCGATGRYLHELSLLDLGSDGCPIEPKFVWGLNYHIRRNAYLEVGGFHPDILSKDYAFYLGDGETGIFAKIKERNYKAFFDARLSLYHTVTVERLTKEYFLRRSYIEGMMDGYTHARSGLPPESLWNPRRMISNTLWFLRQLPILFRDSEVFFLKRDMKRSSQIGYREYLEHFKANEILQRYVKEDNYLDIDRIASTYYGKSAGRQDKASKPVERVAG